MLRVHLQAPVGEELTLYFPADGQKVMDEGGVQPWLFQGSWKGKMLTGALEADEDGYFLFWSNDLVMEIDLPMGRPLAQGEEIAVTLEGVGRIAYVVIDIRRV